VTARRTAQDFAPCLQDLVETHVPEARSISVVLDHLNTHTPAALYETFAPGAARRLLCKLDLRYTPKPGSWLNMADIAFAVLAKPGLDQRLPEPGSGCQQIAAWEPRRHATQATVHWRLTTSKARRTLKGLYPPSRAWSTTS
jgi:DDE superfamily endonuclease